MTRYHINTNTGSPNICRAKTPESCLYYDKEAQAEAPHFDSKQEARAFVEKILSQSIGTTTTVTKKSVDAVSLPPSRKVVKMKTLISLVENGNIEVNVDNLKDIGSVFKSELIDRLGFDPDSLSPKNHDDSKAFEKVGQETRKLLAEIKETGDASAVSITGKYADRLRDAISILPNSVHFGQGLHVSLERKSTKSRSGSFSNGVSSKVADRSVVSAKDLPDDVKVGDFVATSNSYIDSIEEEGSGGTILLVTGERNCSSREDYAVFEKSADRGDQSIIAAMNYIRWANLVDDKGHLSVKPEEIDAKYPGFSEKFYSTKAYDTEAYYISDLGSPKQKGSSWTKVKTDGSGVKISNRYGRSVVVDKPLYRASKTVVDRSINEIRFHEVPWDRDSEKSVLIHEYCHSLQAFGKAPTERSMFNRIAVKGESRYNPSYSERTYDNFPTEYMGASRGDELLPVATEAWLYPEKNQGLYGTGRKESSNDVRDWVAGFWLTR